MSRFNAHEPNREMTETKLDETTCMGDPLIPLSSAVKPEPLSGCSHENVVSHPHLSHYQQMDFLTTHQCIKQEPETSDLPDAVIRYQSWQKSSELSMDVPIQKELSMPPVKSEDQQTAEFGLNLPQAGDELETGKLQGSKGSPMFLETKQEVGIVECPKVREESPHSVDSCVQIAPVPVTLYQRVIKQDSTAENRYLDSDNLGSGPEDKEILFSLPEMSPSVTSEESKVEHHKVKRHKCTVCDYRSITESRLATHMRTHTGEKPFMCSLCGYRYANNNALAAHMKMHTKEMPFKCTACDYRSPSNGLLIEHLRKHTDVKPLTCSVCDHNCSTKWYLIAHMRTHTDEKSFVCTVCDDIFSRSYDLCRHMMIHSNEKPFLCTVCDYSSPNKGALVVHMRTHTGEKPFKCAVCHFRSSKKLGLVEHMKIHTGEPFICSLCNSSCTNNACLAVHMKTHTDEKPFKCSICDYKSNRKSCTASHMATHSEKPFECTLCDYKSDRTSSIVKHMSTHIGDNSLQFLLSLKK